jgi:hypothetical protein
LNEHVAVFPYRSVAVYVTVVIPTVNADPGACDDTSVSTAQLSDAVGAVHVTVLLHESVESDVVIFDGQLFMTGSTFSMSSGAQQMETSLWLFPAITSKSPNESPTNIGVAQEVPIFSLAPKKMLIVI